MLHERIRNKETTTFTLRDSNGRVIPIWRPYFNCPWKVPYLTGRYVRKIRRANTITNVGHAAANGRMSNQGGYSPFVNIALGTGTQGSPTTATALAAEITTLGGGRGAATATQTTTSVTNDTTQLVKTFTFSGNLAITEEGIFDSASASSGSMLAYQSFSVINVANGNTLTITHTYQT